MITTVLMDGDGSTLTPDNCLPTNLRDLILQNPHINWVMATGRSLDLLKITPIFDYLSADVPHILDGGAKIMCLDGKIVQDNLLTENELTLFYELLQLELVNFLYYSPDGVKRYGYSKDQATQHRFAKHKVISTDEIAEFKVWTFSSRPAKLLMNVKSDFNLGDLYYHRNENNIDITTEGVNKGAACNFLLNYLKIKPEHVAFVFNGNNDLPLVLHPDLLGIKKIKVGNALPNIKAEYYAESPFDVATILTNLIG